MNDDETTMEALRRINNSVAAGHMTGERLTSLQDELAEYKQRALEAERQVRAANRLADEVAVLVDRKVIGSRHPAADALLDYRDPPQSERSDRLAILEERLERVRQLANENKLLRHFLWPDQILELLPDPTERT